MLVWQEKYSVGNKEIDNQHKKLFGIINVLQRYVKENRGEEIIVDVIAKLISYALYHFNTEERYFDIYNYEYTEEHKKEHQIFIDKVESFKEEYVITGEKSKLSQKVLDFLNDWIVSHLLDEDAKYKYLFFNNQ